MALNRVLAVLIVAATAVFAIGVSLEDGDMHDEAAAEATDIVGGASAGSEESGEHFDEAVETESHDEEGEDEELLGIDLESTPLVVLAVAFSLALAVAVWVRPELAALLVVIALAMLAFAALDVRELFHQVDENESGLAVFAGLVAALHAAAAGLAFKLERNLRRGRRPA